MAYLIGSTTSKDELERCKEKHINLTEGYTLLKGVPLDDTVLLHLAGIFGTPLMQIDGPVLEMKVNVDGSQDVKFTNREIPWHNDMLYKDKLLSYVLLACISAPSSGGRTAIMDGETAAKVLLQEEPTFKEVVLRYRRGNEAAAWPLIYINPTRGNPTLLYRQGYSTKREDVEVVVGPTSINKDDIIARIEKILASIHPTYAHSWEIGDFLMVDNRRCLHSRERFQGNRIVRRIVVTN